MHNRDLYHNNSCVKKINLKSIQNFNNENTNRANLHSNNNLGSKILLYWSIYPIQNVKMKVMK